MAPSIARAFTLTLGDEEDEQTLALNCPCEHHLAPLLMIVPVQMLAWHTAGLKASIWRYVFSTILTAY